MYERNNSLFKKHIIGEAPSPTTAFWENVPASDPRMTGHPAKTMPKHNLVPLRLHGDGVQIAKAANRSYDVISFSSMVGNMGANMGHQIFCFRHGEWRKVADRDDAAGLDNSVVVFCLLAKGKASCSRLEPPPFR